MIGRAKIAELLPHGEAMVLLDAVQDWDRGGITCHTSSHRRDSNPLRSGGGLPAIAAVEYGVQAVLTHAGLQAGWTQDGKLGSLHRLCLAVDWLHDLPGLIQIHAEVRSRGTGGMIYAFGLSAGEKELASGLISIVLR